MPMPSSSRRFLLLLGACAGWLRPGTGLAANPPAGRAGSVDFVQGDASVADAAGVRKLSLGAPVLAGQTVQTGIDAEVHILLDDGGYLTVRQRSSVLINSARIQGAFDDSLAMTLLKGAMRSITGWVGKFDKQSYQLTVGTATVGIRGTDHEVALILRGEEGPEQIAGIHNWVNEGGTTLKTAAGSLDIAPGQAAWAAHGGLAPRMHAGLPAFLQRFRSRHEARAEKHALRVRERIEERMRKRGFLQPGEHLEDVQARHRLWRERQHAHAAQREARLQAHGRRNGRGADAE